MRFPWFRRKEVARLPEKFRAEQLHFLGEHDGAPERELKDKLIQLFERRKDIQRAYLAITQYEDIESINVALCIRAKWGRHPLLREIGQVFSSIFNAEEHLDILYLTEEQEERLSRVCRPFWNAWP